MVDDDVICDPLDLHLRAPGTERGDNHVIKFLVIEPDERRIALGDEKLQTLRGIRLMPPEVEPLTRVHVFGAEQCAVGHCLSVENPGRHTGRPSVSVIGISRLRTLAGCLAGLCAPFEGR